MNTLEIEKLTPPTRPGEWSIDQVIAALSRPLPPPVSQQRKQSNTVITYLPWHEANKILNKYCPGWNWEIRQMTTTCDRLFLVGRLSIPTCDGIVYREASGTELLKEEKAIWIGGPDNRRPLKDEYDDLRSVVDHRPVTEPRELAYGDPSSNAESMAFRRAAARFGLGLYLY